MRNWMIAILPLAAACGIEAGQSAAETTVAESSAPSDAAGPADEIAEAVLTAEGWGPLRIGMTLEEVKAAAGPDADPDAVGGPEPEYCDQFRPERAPEGLYVMIEEGILTRISLSEPAGVETDAGLGIGAGADEVRAAHGERLHAEPHHYLELPAEYLTVWAIGDPGEEAYTEDPAARGIRYETDLERRVETIHAGSSSIQYIEGCL